MFLGSTLHAGEDNMYRLHCESSQSTCSIDMSVLPAALT